MQRLLRTAAIAIALSGATLAGGCTTNTRGTLIQTDAGVSLGFGRVNSAYRDGNWDQQRRWSSRTDVKNGFAPMLRLRIVNNE